jgi:hypothetical protein
MGLDYPVLKREGLIKPAEIVGFKVGKEYRRKTNQSNELWASDCYHFSIPKSGCKIKRYHRTIKSEINQLSYEIPDDLKESIGAFIEYYNYRRYHEGLGNVTPYNIYTGKHLEILQRGKKEKSRTLQTRKDYNKTARKMSKLHILKYERIP